MLSTLFSSTRRLDYDFSSNKVEDFDTTNWLRKIGHSLSRYVQCQWGFEATLSPWDNLLGVRRHCLLHDAILSGNEDFVLHMVKIFALFDSEELASPLTNIDGKIYLICKSRRLCLTIIFVFLDCRPILNVVGNLL